jgi:hypothetical protein
MADSLFHCINWTDSKIEERIPNARAVLPSPLTEALFMDPLPPCGSELSLGQLPHTLADLKRMKTNPVQTDSNQSEPSDPSCARIEESERREPISENSLIEETNKISVSCIKLNDHLNAKIPDMLNINTHYADFQDHINEYIKKSDEFLMTMHTKKPFYAQTMRQLSRQKASQVVSIVKKKVDEKMAQIRAQLTPNLGKVCVNLRKINSNNSLPSRGSDRAARIDSDRAARIGLKSSHQIRISPHVIRICRKHKRSRDVRDVRDARDVRERSRDARERSPDARERWTIRRSFQISNVPKEPVEELDIEETNENCTDSAHASTDILFIEPNPMLSSPPYPYTKPSIRAMWFDWKQAPIEPHEELLFRSCREDRGTYPVSMGFDKMPLDSLFPFFIPPYQRSRQWS